MAFGMVAAYYYPYLLLFDSIRFETAIIITTTTTVKVVCLLHTHTRIGRSHNNNNRYNVNTRIRARDPSRTSPSSHHGAIIIIIIVKLLTCVIEWLLRLAGRIGDKGRRLVDPLLGTYYYTRENTIQTHARAHIPPAG